MPGDAAGYTSGNVIVQAPYQIVFGTGNAASDVYIKEVAGGLSFSQPISVPSTSVLNPGGHAVLVAKADLTTQAASISATTLYAVPATGAGTYRITAYLVVTQAASVSSTLPSFGLSYTDNDTNTTNGNLGGSTSAGNTVGTTATTTTFTVNAKASTNIQYAANSYASSGATPMQYAIHVKLEFLGA